MATMYPDVLPDQIRSDPLRRAEVDVYRALERSLPSEYAVLYSVAWLSIDSSIDGEADFVVLHPSRGLFVIEVKGGRKVWRNEGGQWHSESHSGHVYNIKNPVEQAKSSKYRLIEQIRKMPAMESQWIPAAHGVVLPAVSYSGQDMGADAPESIFAFASDMGELGTRLLTIWDSQINTDRPVGQEAIDGIRKHLAPSFVLSPAWGQMIPALEQEMIRLTETQFNAFNAMSRNRRIAIFGGAGTGKTLLAIGKARKTSEQGLRTLYTCFNRPLRDEISQSQGESPYLEILTFHQLCAQFAKSAGIGDSLGDNYADYPQMLTRALDIVGPKYDVVVVDEAQDFYQQGLSASADDASDWLAALELCLDGPGVLNIFLDTNQMVYGGNLRLPQETSIWDLTDNLRNTRQIHSIARRHYSGSEFATAGPRGPRPEFVQVAHEDFTALVKNLRQQLDRLGDSVSTADTVVLASSRALMDKLFASEIGARLRSVRQTSSDGLVYADTVARFKGLEASAVVLVGLGGFAGDVETTYVGVTRAKSVLALIGQKSDIDFVKNGG
jgi:ATP:corrinoid adenosyltransferase